jgi:hypothetical protein
MNGLWITNHRVLRGFQPLYMVPRRPFDARSFFAAKTLRGTLLSVPLECCLTVCSIRYFFFAVFFAAFFAAFFAGFLAAFFVAIFLFSLFDGLHRFCNLKTADEKCIDSCDIDVKKKTT